MTIPIDVEVEIRRLHFAEHWPVGTIVSQLGVHEETVRRVLGLLRPRAPEQPATPRPRLVDSYVDFITETLARYPRLRSTRLFDMLRQRGYAGSVRTLREYVAEVRPLPRREVFLRVERFIGEQSQVDWAHVGEVDVDGGRRSLWLFVILLGWSRAMWGEFVFDLSVHSLLRSLSRASAFFGGTTRQWLFDNPKIVVLERHGDAVRFHPLLLELAGHYRVQLRLCRVRKPTDKGGVERLIRFVRERFLAGRTIRDIEHGNREFAAFRDEIAHARSHPTLPGRTVADCFTQERKCLLPLPVPSPQTDVVVPIDVDGTAFVRFDTNDYSVPSIHANHTRTLVADDREVRVLDGTDVVARHARSWGRRRQLEAPEHRADLLAHKHAAAEPKGRDRLRAAVPAIDALYERWVEAGRNLGNMTGRTIKLLDLYGAELLAEAVREVLVLGTHDPGALGAICEQRRRVRCQPVPIDLVLGDHVPDRDVIPHPLETYDANRRRR